MYSVVIYYGITFAMKGSRPTTFIKPQEQLKCTGDGCNDDGDIGGGDEYKHENEYKYEYDYE